MRVHKKNKTIIDQLVFSLFFSKIFERLFSRQLLEYFDNILSEFQCGFRKGYGTQHRLLLMLEIWKGATENDKAFRALLTDLSKAFDCLSHCLS